MAYDTNIVANQGAFVPTTNEWDVGRLYEVNVNSDEFKELLVRLYQNVNIISLVLNLKSTGYYLNVEFGNSNQYYNLTIPAQFRPGFQISVDTGALNAGVKSVPHGLSPQTPTLWKAMKIYGGATIAATPAFYPLPFASATGNNIEVTITATNVVINNQSGQTFTDSTVTFEYVKN